MFFTKMMISCALWRIKKFPIQKQDSDRSLQRLIIRTERFLAKKTTVQELDFDPSEHLDWNWEDFE